MNVGKGINKVSDVFEVTDKMWLAAANAYDNQMRMTNKTSAVYLEPLKAAIKEAILASDLHEEIISLMKQIDELQKSKSPDLCTNHLEEEGWIKCQGSTNPVRVSQWVNFKAPNIIWGCAPSECVSWSEDVYYKLCDPPVVETSYSS